MAVTVFEKPKSRQVSVDFNQPSETREYGAFGDENVTAVLTAVASFAPAFVTIPDAGTGLAINLLPRQITPVEFSPGVWDITIRYQNEAASAFVPGSSSPSGSGTSNAKFTLTFNFSNQVVKTHRAIADVRAYNAVEPVGGTTTTAASDAEASAAALLIAANAIDTNDATDAALNALTFAAVVGVDATVKTETELAASKTDDVVAEFPAIISAAYTLYYSVLDAAASARAGDVDTALIASNIAIAQLAIITASLTVVDTLADEATTASVNADAAVPMVDPGGVSQDAADAAAGAAAQAQALNALLVLLEAAGDTASDDAGDAWTAVAADPALGSAIPDFHRMIGVTDSGVEGMDVEKGACEITIEKKWDKAILPSGYLQILANYNDETPVNDAPYTITYLGQSIVCARGTLRLRSATVTTDSGLSLTINYVFSYRRNLTTADNFTIGNSAPIVMEGHHGFWIRTKKMESNKVTVEVPQSVHIVQIYPYRPFGVLAI